MLIDILVYEYIFYSKIDNIFNIFFKIILHFMSTYYQRVLDDKNYIKNDLIVY